METHTAAFAILHEAAKSGFRVPKRPLDYHERSCLIQAIVTRAEAGDKPMVRIFEQMGRYLGLGIANLVNLLNPQRIVICEGAIRCSHLFESSLRAVAEQMVIPPLKRNLEIVIHHWGDEVWARGAASLVLLELDQRGRPERPEATKIAGRRSVRNGKIRAAVSALPT
jgi:predicted NBD/HSP70 family sugar kinase